MFAIRPSLVYLCRQLLEASRLRHFVLRSLQNGSTDANAATVTQDNFFEHGDSCNADVCMSALRPDTPEDASSYCACTCWTAHLCHSAGTREVCRIARLWQANEGYALQDFR